VTALIAGSAIRTCLGNGEATFSALLRGTSGIGDLRYISTGQVGVKYGYPIREAGEEDLFRASRWLTACVQDALMQSSIDPERQRVLAIVGTGLRELRAVERAAVESIDFPTEFLHFASAIQQVSPHIRETITLSNACSAGGHALALAQDLIELGEADAVVVGGADAMTASMLAMIGRFAVIPTDQVRPFDAQRTGVLLGDGAAALLVVPEGSTERPLARVLATGLSCDAHHETVPDTDGIYRAVQDAFARAHREPASVDLLIAHGTGTALNDPTEANLIRRVFASAGPGPLITAVKGAVGHNSGVAPLVSMDVAMRCLKKGLVPPIVGLRQPLNEGNALRFVTPKALAADLELVTINAFGFGGVNSVTLIEAVH
jgi:3-oxoacyl-[acyl-carrier-protein] synthase II